MHVVHAVYLTDRTCAFMQWFGVMSCRPKKLQEKDALLVPGAMGGTISWIALRVYVVVREQEGQTRMIAWCMHARQITTWIVPVYHYTGLTSLWIVYSVFATEQVCGCMLICSISNNDMTTGIESRRCSFTLVTMIRRSTGRELVWYCTWNVYCRARFFRVQFLSRGSPPAS